MMIQLEKYEEIVDDILPMLEAHWSEVEWGKEKIPLKPNLATYKAASDAGTVAMFAVRDVQGKMIGYATFWLYDHPHHEGTVFAVNDMFYLLPDYRRTEFTTNLVYTVEQDLKKLGVNVVTYSMKTKYRFESLMFKTGYEHTECVYSRYIS